MGSPEVVAVVQSLASALIALHDLRQAASVYKLAAVRLLRTEPDEEVRAHDCCHVWMRVAHCCARAGPALYGEVHGAVRCSARDVGTVAYGSGRSFVRSAYFMFVHARFCLASRCCCWLLVAALADPTLRLLLPREKTTRRKLRSCLSSHRPAGQRL